MVANLFREEALEHNFRSNLFKQKAEFFESGDYSILPELHSGDITIRISRFESTIFLSPLIAAEIKTDLFRQGSQKSVIRGVYHLINQNDSDAAESEFRQAIAWDRNNKEAYYFLGKIYYDRAASMEDLPASQSSQYIGKAKALLLRAQELGISYDKLHPDLLSQLKKEYPKIAPIYEEELFPKAKIVFETEFGIQTSEISQQMSPHSSQRQPDEKTTTETFQPEEEISLKGDTAYQLEFLPKKPKNIKHLILLGIGLTIWLIR